MKFLKTIFCLILFSQCIYSQDATGRTKPGTLSKPDINTSIPKIWAVVIGVSKYQTPDMDLKFADKDAKFYYDYLLSPSGGNVSKDNSILLLNEEATRERIIKEINDKCNRSFDDDLIILYLACHGMPEPVGDEIYFLSYDAKPDNLAGTAVSQTDIMKALSHSRAQKKIWIADACHSAGDILNVRGNRSYLLNKMLLEIATAGEGLALFAASSASEFSQENEKWGGGHGVFTYYFLEGLKGAADMDNDGIITIRELYNYVYAKVNEDTNGQQHPVLQGKFDNKLPVGISK
jgi:uncharacterized caspase-like protein